MLAEAKALTSREKKLVRRIALGRSDRKIAIQIGGTEAKIATQRRRVPAKLRSKREIAEAAERLAARKPESRAPRWAE